MAAYFTFYVRFRGVRGTQVYFLRNQKHEHILPFRERLVSAGFMFPIEPTQWVVIMPHCIEAVEIHAQRSFMPESQGAGIAPAGMWDGE